MASISIFCSRIVSSGSEIRQGECNSTGNPHCIYNYPDDAFNRYWQPFIDGNPTVESHANVTSSEFWNRPPEKVFLSGSTTSRGKNLTIHWPPFSLPANRYYVALYFQDNRNTSPYSWRLFTVFIDGEVFYQDLNVTTKGVTVYGTEWPLSGETEITLIPRSDMPVGPTINAGEIFQILPLSGTTFGGDGTLPKEIARLTALKELRLSTNKLTGPIPDLSPLKALEILHLDENEFEGPFPDALATLPNLRELLLNKNKLSGGPPQNLIDRKGMIIRT
ncbi:hypothetical protein SSX86_024030 [Deinandra increscens subsp. villosa]|uniref:Malectin-like domain-containing protein n=1 Tax=Deinandra increscens subsp. villosa TaxID=3103831 RepID=A0AAP0GNC0_9ASTR